MRGHVDVTWGDHGGISPEVSGRNVFLWIFTLLRVIVFCSCSVFNAWNRILPLIISMLVIGSLVPKMEIPFFCLAACCQGLHT